MEMSDSRQDLIDRLRYTFLNSEYHEIDVLINGLKQKPNFEVLCEEFFKDCHIDSRGNLIPEGFFSNSSDSAKNPALFYAMYELLGMAPDTFLLKHRVLRVKMTEGNFFREFHLPQGLFMLPQLKILIIRNMGLRELPEMISEVSSLRILDLAGNKLTCIPKSILKLTRLSALNLSFNRITTLPCMSRFKSLRLLSLRGNRISSLPDNWCHMQYLRTLDLAMNRIVFIPESLRTLSHLQDLNLSYNDLNASTEAYWEKSIQSGNLRNETQGSLEFG